jgi:hypothetical protein
MKFEQAIKIASEDKKIVMYVDAGTTYGELHDYLMFVKGTVVEKLNEAHKREMEVTKKVKEQDAKKGEKIMNLPTEEA